MAVRSKALGLLGETPAGAWAVVAGAPEGRTAIVKDLSLQLRSETTGRVTLAVRRGSLYVAFAYHPTSVRYEVRRWQGMQLVLEPGDELVVFAHDVGGNFAVGAWGALLVGAPA